MGSGSPEPSRNAGAAPTSGTAVQTSGDVRPAGAPRAVTVVNEQDLPVDHVRLERLATHVLDVLDVPVELELSIACVGTARIAELNEDHLDGTGATDVLAFPIDGPDDVTAGVPGLLGDVVLCPAVAARQAPEHGRTAGAEIELLVVHGILHLLGHDHAEPGERAEMFALTDELLARFAAAAP